MKKINAQNVIKYLVKVVICITKKHVDCMKSDITLYDKIDKINDYKNDKCIGYNYDIENIGDSPGITNDKNIYRIKELEEKLKLAEENIIQKDREIEDKNKEIEDKNKEIKNISNKLSFEQEKNKLLEKHNSMHEEYISALSKSELYVDPNIFDNQHGVYMLSNNQNGMTLNEFLAPITKKEGNTLRQNWLFGCIDYITDRYVPLKPCEKPFYCTDHSRKTFIYKDDNGRWKKDPNGTQICYLITNKICKFYREEYKNAKNWNERNKYIEFGALTFNNFAKKVFHKERIKFYIKNVVKVIDK